MRTAWTQGMSILTHIQTQKQRTKNLEQFQVSWHLRKNNMTHGARPRAHAHAILPKQRQTNTDRNKGLASRVVDKDVEHVENNRVGWSEGETLGKQMSAHRRYTQHEFYDLRGVTTPIKHRLNTSSGGTQKSIEHELTSGYQPCKPEGTHGTHGKMCSSDPSEKTDPSSELTEHTNSEKRQTRTPKIKTNCGKPSSHDAGTIDDSHFTIRSTYW